MKDSHSRIETLKQLLGLEDRRARLQQELDALTQEIHSAHGSLFGGATSSKSILSAASNQPAASEATPKAAAHGRGGRRKRMKRGALKEQIMSALHTAGEAGVRVTELAKALTIKPVNIHSWFHSALSRNPQIKKLQGGHYRLTGSGVGNHQPARSNGNGASSTSATRKTSGGPSAKPAKPAAAGRSGNRRGELTSRILSELQGAGAKGITVRALSEKVGAPYKNIYIWFATTGKKNAKVKKLGPAHYKLS